MNPDLLILAATHFEVSHFLRCCPGVSKRFTKIGQQVLSGKIRDKTYDLMITGPGVFNAAHALTTCLEQSSPGLILQTGIAGGFRQTGLAMGDVAIATREHYIHTGVGTDGLENDALPFDLIEADYLSRKGIYSFEQNRVDHAHTLLSRAVAQNQITISRGPFITVSCLTSSFHQADRIYSAFSPVMESMEGAASSHIAALYGIPIIEIRAVSNFVGQRDRSKWNIDLAVKQLGLVCACL